MESNIKLKYLIDLDFLQDFQDKFAKATGVASIMVDDEGPITKPSNFTDFCIKYTRGSQLGYQKCNECDIKWGKIAAEKGEPVIYDCHSGLTDFAVPIMLAGKHIGSILGGQVLTQEPDEEHFRNIAREFGINEDEYIVALRKIKIIPREQVEAAAQLMFVVANSISQKASKNYELLEATKNEKILKQIMLSSYATFNMEEIIKSVVTEAGIYFSADRCFFIEEDGQTDTNLPVRAYAEYVSSTDIVSHTQVTPKKEETSIFVKIRKTEDVIVVNDIGKIDLPEATRKMLVEDLLVKSYLIVSVRYQEINYGAMVLHYVKDYKQFSQNDIDIAEAIAKQSAIIIHQSKLYEKMQKTVKREVVLRQIIEITRNSHNIDKIKSQVVEVLAKTFKADRCYFRSYDMAQSKFSTPEVEYLASPGIKSLLNLGLGIEISRFLSDELKKMNNGFYPIVTNDSIIKNTPLEPHLEKLGIKASCAIPIPDGEGKYIWLFLNYLKENPELDEDNIKLFETIAFQLDMAFRQIKLYNANKQQAEREKAILSNLPFMVWLKDTNGVLLAVNEPYAKMCGDKIENIIGKTDYDFFPKEHADLYVEEDKKVMRRKKTMFSEDIIIGPDGPRWHETYKTPLLDEKGEVVGTTGFSRDVTERKEIDKMKNEFVSMVSHELRTPLTSIRGSLGLVTSGKVGELSSTTKELLDIANNNCLRLINLINDILDIEKIEAGKMDFEIKNYELMHLVERSIQDNHQYAQKFGVELKLTDIVENVNVKVDANRLIQVLTNLLSNAIKFSDSDLPVTIAVSSSNNRARITITNYGAEISSEFKNKIFQKFAQADSSDARKKGGTGLGLSISKAIIEKLGGHINFISENNETMFTFDLPVVIEEKPVIAERKDNSSPNILICEDDKDIAFLMSVLLKQEGYSTDIAYSAAQAKQLLEQREYDAMTLDLILPDKDGISLLKELRTHKKTENLPIIVVSIKAHEGEKQVEGRFAVVDWIDKPIQRDRLLNAVKLATSGGLCDKPRILHVEDDEDVLKITYSILKNDAIISQVTNLKDAAAVLEKDTFDLLLLDLELPDGNGVELLPMLNQNDGKKIITVIFSAHDVKADVAKQVDAVLLKSNTTNEDLLAIVNSIKQKLHVK